VKNRFQNLPFEFNLQRYSKVAAAEKEEQRARNGAGTPPVGLCTLESS
jgi:hypothetical protein